MPRISNLSFSVPILCLMWVCAALSCHGAEWDDPTLPQADPDKPVLQAIVPGVFGIGGLHKKVRIPSVEDLEKRLLYEYKLKLQQIQLKEIQRGSWMFLIGLVVAGVGIVLHFVTAYPILQRCSEWVLVSGASLSGIGLVIKKAAQYQNFLMLGLGVVIVGVVMYKCRNWSLSHLINKGNGKPNESSNRERN